MSDTSAGVTVGEIAAPVPRPAPLPLPGWFAALQVFAVCGVPTQLVITVGLILAGGVDIPTDLKQLPLGFFATISLLDTAAIALLIRLFLWLSGEQSRDVFVGFRSVGREFARGLLLVPVVLGAVIGLNYVFQTWFPGLHNVSENPYSHYMDSPIEAVIFILVVLLAGGVREELARAFSLHRFGQRLGGAPLGLLIYSAAFGALHFPQGFDAMITVSLLGLFWGWLYLRRRSVVASMVNHGVFDASQVLLQLLARSIRV